MSRLRRRLAAATLPLLLSPLVACGDDSAETETPDTPDATSSFTQPPTTSAPVTAGSDDDGTGVDNETGSNGLEETGNGPENPNEGESELDDQGGDLPPGNENEE